MTPIPPAGVRAPQSISAVSPEASARDTRVPDAAIPDAAIPDAAIPGQRVLIGSPTSLIAVIPGLLGFEPGRSLVVIGVVAPRAAVRVSLRYDLPDPRDPRLAQALAEHVTSILTAQGIITAVAVGFGTEEVVSPVVEALRRQAAVAGIALTELLRVADQRYWSYVCTDPACCPPEGTPFDVTDHPAVRAFEAAGGRVLASRDELTATVAPVGGRPARTVRRATREAVAHVVDCVARLQHAGMRVGAGRLTGVIGVVAVRDAIRRYRAGEAVSLEHAAWLTVALRQLRVRDDAWTRMDPEHRGAHRRLWTDLTRLARPGYVAAPASLLAFVAWQSGNGALANVALDRALADDPRYSMALLLRRALDSGAPPSLALLPMSPEEVEASYDALDNAAEEAETRADARAGAARRNAAPRRATRSGGSPRS
jgi:hypothetical protein